MGSVSRKTALRIIYWNIVAAVIIVCLAGVSLVRRIHRYDDMIVRTGKKYDLDPRLISAVIWQESRFRPDRVGTKQEVGLMQVTQAAGTEWAEAEGVENFHLEMLFDPQKNIDAGAWYLGRAMRRWSHCDDPAPYALAEYNAGRSNALRWSKKSGNDSKRFWESITYPTTKKYVEKILKRYRGKV